MAVRIRSRSWWLASLLVLPLLCAGLPALAATPSSAPAAAAAKEADMALYSRIAAVNVCISRAAGIAFDTAVGVAGETMAQVIEHQHGGVIEQVGREPLALDALRKGSINSAVLGAAEVCPEEVPEGVRKEVEAALQRSGGAEAIPPPPQPGPVPKAAATPTR
ncbi:cAMP phosphodiesterase [Cyanobium sp. PCC 7001]|uniref:cAMP phosphodiesterase n=1 Tax=Cyanobium sp. PCC 7001 TaxID=180281 RepID=UPI0003161629|nr:cAMP phosphodiesterase [Cyanobium sp. PCC 7001]